MFKTLKKGYVYNIKIRICLWYWNNDVYNINIMICL